ncbi:retron St85 family RNA-directed DNA polymerase [Schinkia azotoformans]|uniref:retron St85 family RNA-directed DNA polymerase n=1 Tax=Schinkia azotoformans TaxID=1454 RepID=UPI002E1D99EE|nr:retron St85 family RNA-directed DNA polymerase [Schinkia azotoformans]MED4354325.1 retron St85 family RNA-directed DNA polymerase [Schinkia azotoformans]
MKWSNYEASFIKTAIDAGHDEEYRAKYLSIAHRLFISGVPIIFDQFHLSNLVGIKYEYLLKVSNSQSLFYRYFRISKKNGGYRKIAEPLPNLKLIQRWILEEILNKYKVSEFAKAYRKNVSLRENAKFHRKQSKVLSLDIKDFFGSIKHIEVFYLFKTLGYPREVSAMLANICTLKGSLPQGAITSPAISNIIMKVIDKRLAGYAIKNKIRYTRYADDLTFSGDFDEGRLIKFVEEVLKSKGFELNNKKTRVRFQHQRQEVTGVVVNEKIQATREMRKNLRKNMYYIKKYGLDSHIERINTEKTSYVKHLLGIANFIYFLNEKDKEVELYLKELKEIWREISFITKH